MSGKKIVWIILLIAIIVAMVVGVVFARPKENNTSNTADETFGKSTENNASEKGVEENDSVRTNEAYQKIQLDDGILYSLTGEKVQADLVIGDDYFDTTISDIFLNPKNYENKTIQIEGLYFVNDPYTFVGRYSNSNLCPDCPPGYSYLEYQLQGKMDAKLTDEKDWIKVVGTLDKGNDETSNYEDYYFLKVQTLEIMNERGQDTVNN